MWRYLIWGDVDLEDADVNGVRYQMMLDVGDCKLCSVVELTEQLDCKSMEIKWYIYMKVDP